MECAFCGRDKDKEEVKKMLTNDDKNLNICEICIKRCAYLLQIHKCKKEKVIPFDYQSKVPDIASDCFDFCKSKECVKGECPIKKE